MRISDLSSVVCSSDRFQSVTKRLVLDLTTLNLPKLDNIEGMAWGPPLANGNRSLVLVSDDNFNASQVTQLLAFEVLSSSRHANVAQIGRASCRERVSQYVVNVAVAI